MKTSFKIHAGLQLALGVGALLMSGLTSVPGVSLNMKTGLLFGICLALLLPLHAATIFRSINLDFRSGGAVSNKSLQWQALRNLPRLVHVFLVGVGLAGAALLSGATSTSVDHLSGGEASYGRYTAVDTTDPHRRRIAVTKSEYDRLQEQEQRTMFAIYGLIAAGGGAFTLMVAELDASTRRS
ncbi:hypothetical protein ACFC0D_03295 [Streptomyces sp. NPDC056222]|uniref:hypothetical protein n=1 Tax=Streptomyces sp. NPDC056222 TaxID=3345749 RepID=UPI0035D862A4